MLRFYKETALSLSRSVNFIPSSLTTMLSFASVHGFLLQIAIWLQELLLTRVYGPMGASWSPPVILSFPLNPETGHHFPQQLLHNPKSAWATLQLQTLFNVLHIRVSLGRRMSLRERRWRLSEMGLVFSQGKQTYQKFFCATMKLRCRGLSEEVRLATPRSIWHPPQVHWRPCKWFPATSPIKGERGEWCSSV